MTEPDQAVIARLSADFAAIAAYLARASVDLRHLERIVAQRQAPTGPPVPQTVPDAPQAPPQAWPPGSHWQPHPGFAFQPGPQPPAATAAPSVPAAPTWPGPMLQQPNVFRPQVPRSEGWIGKALAVAGVAVTLVGVALLLVLAAQAGILRPEFRVAAGAVLAGGLVGAGWWLNRRPGGRVGAIALAATGIAAGYIDVIAVTTIYGWAPAPVGLVLAAGVAGAGLALARRWNSEHLGLLVLVPLIGLAPVVTDGVTLLLVGFMLALSAASVPVQLGRDWIWLHAARMAAATLPLLVALVALTLDSGQSGWLAASSALAAVLAIGSALVLLPRTHNSLAMALLSSAGTVPLLAASLVVDRVVAALLAALLAVVLLAIVLLAARMPMVTGPVRSVWSALAAVSGLITVVVAFDGPVAGPVLLATAAVVAVAGRRSQVARWCALGFAVVGGLNYLVTAPLSTLFTPTAISSPAAASTLVASLLVVACAVAIAWSWPADWSWAITAVVALYAVTMFTVTAGVLIGGDEQGFFGGHVAATICWIALTAGVFRYATRVPRAQRSLPIGGGMALVAAAMAKLFLFDLGTLDGIFRVVVFIVVGLILLGMGAGYARILAQQDDRDRV